MILSEDISATLIGNQLEVDNAVEFSRYSYSVIDTELSWEPIGHILG